MAVESAIISVVYAVTSASAGQEFPIPFPYIEKEHVIAYYAVDREYTFLTYGTDYTVDNATLTVTGALPVGARLVIHRVTPMTQDIVWVDGQAVYTPDIMQADDKLTYITQELKEQLDRTIKVDASSPKTADELLDDIFDARDNSAASAAESSDYADASAASALRAQEWAESEMPPDAEDADSKSAKSWAELASTAKGDAEDAVAQAQAWAESDTNPDPDDNASKSAKTWANMAIDSVSAASASESNAATSEANAASSASAAAISETNAAASEANAATSEANAAESARLAGNIKLYCNNRANDSDAAATRSATSATNAAQSATASAQSATASANSVTAASSAASDAADSAELAQAWAESSTPPDPNDPDSKSAKEWAMTASSGTPIATTSYPGKVQPDGLTININENGVISAPGTVSLKWSVTDVSQGVSIDELTSRNGITFTGLVPYKPVIFGISVGTDRTWTVGGIMFSVYEGADMGTCCRATSQDTTHFFLGRVKISSTTYTGPCSTVLIPTSDTLVIRIMKMETHTSMFLYQ